MQEIRSVKLKNLAFTPSLFSCREFISIKSKYRAERFPVRDGQLFMFADFIKAGAFDGGMDSFNGYGFPTGNGSKEGMYFMEMNSLREKGQKESG